MIILHVFHSFWPVLGGIERAIYYLSKEFIRMGHEVIVLTSNYGSSNRPQMEFLDGIRIFRVKSKTLHFAQLTIPLEKAPLDLINDADIVYAWDQTSFFTYTMIKEVKSRDKKVAMYFIGVDYLEHHYNTMIRFLGSKYQRWITKRISNLIDIAIVTTEHERLLLKQRYNLDAIVIPHGVDKIYFELPNMAKEFRSKYHIDNNKRIIAYINRIHPTKGLDMLIKAFAIVSRKFPDLILVIAGKGDQKYLAKCLKLVEKLNIKDKVKYVGFLSEEDKIGLIDASELIIIPSKHAGENYSLVVDEVKARGKPLVVTNYGALPHRIQNHIEGIVVNANVNSLAEGIIYTLSNLKSFRIQTNPYTWDKIASELLERILEV